MIPVVLAMSPLRSLDPKIYRTHVDYLQPNFVQGNFSARRQTSVSYSELNTMRFFRILP